ncbi:MAG TPA: chloride channel protein [Dongiaceae bacterium]|nr:chloride channel protein [Dongiaceae bacterium]
MTVASHPGPVPPHRRFLGAVSHRAELYARFAARKLTSSRLRDSEVALLLVAVAIGAAVSAITCLTGDLLVLLRITLFGSIYAAHLSGAAGIDPLRLLAVPILGSLAYGFIAWSERRLRGRDVVDPIEANALYGGKMSLRDSIALAIMTLFSAGIGASVGMEAAYTQSGAGLASQAGQWIRFRRNDLRILVGCGAAAAISAAFNAPLAGSFYAFELVIGAYSLSALAPVGMAAVTAAVVGRSFFGLKALIDIPEQIPPGNVDFLYFAAIGIAAALIGVVTMRAVTGIESILQEWKLPRGIRPFMGGLVLGGIAFAFPQVLGSGHGAIETTIIGLTPPFLLTGLLAAKIAASAASVGSGLRGGLFSSSLLIGALLGGLIGQGAILINPALGHEMITFTLVGMGAVGAAIVGAPVTMILLVLELTGSYSITIGVIVAVLLASFGVRQWFGYSFSTWRFHQRGLKLQGAHDVGWIQELTAETLMQRDMVFVRSSDSLEATKAAHPAGETGQLFVLDDDGGYRGAIDVPTLHLMKPPTEGAANRVGDLLPVKQPVLARKTPIRAILQLFAESELEVLAVVDSTVTRYVLGYCTEAYVLRRYNQELERRRSEELGHSDLFGPAEER